MSSTWSRIRGFINTVWLRLHSYMDPTFWDATDGASEDWWRGHDYALEIAKRDTRFHWKKKPKLNDVLVEAARFYGDEPFVISVGSITDEGTTPFSVSHECLRENPSFQAPTLKSLYAAVRAAADEAEDDKNTEYTREVGEDGNQIKGRIC